jgi:hypothetical protein
VTEAQARVWVAQLRAHYPRGTFTQDNFDAYTRLVQRWPDGGATQVLAHLIATLPHLPATSEIAQAFATAAVGAPLAVVAWEQVQAYVAYTPVYVDCTVCGGTGDDTARGGGCSHCRGLGEVERPGRPPLHPVARRAMESMGGAYTVRTAAEPGIVRAQYLRTYEDFLRLATEVAATGGAWQAALVMAGPAHRLQQARQRPTLVQQDLLGGA